MTEPDHTRSPKPVKKDTAQTVKQQSPHGKYFHIMLNIADDDLDPFEYRLLGHYIRRGTCTEGIAKTAEICKMSVAKVRSTRLALEKLGYISIEQVSGKGTRITIIDRVEENVQRCTPTKSARGKRKQTPIENVRGEDIVTPIENDSPPLPKTSGVPLSKTSPKEEHIQEPSKKNIPDVPGGTSKKALSETRKPQATDPIFDAISQGSFGQSGKTKSSFIGGLVFGFQDRHELGVIDLEFGEGNKPTCEQAEEYATDLIAAYKYHHSQIDRATHKPLSPPTNALKIHNMVRRYRESPAYEAAHVVLDENGMNLNELEPDPIYPGIYQPKGAR